MIIKYKLKKCKNYRLTKCTRVFYKNPTEKNISQEFLHFALCAILPFGAIIIIRKYPVIPIKDKITKKHF